MSPVPATPPRERSPRLRLVALAVAALASTTACRKADRPSAADAARPPDASPVAARPAEEVPPPGDDASAEAPPADPPLVVQGTAVPPPVAMLESCAGECRVARLETAPRAPADGVGPATPLYAGDLLEASADGPAELTLAGGARLRLRPGSRLLLGLQRPSDLGLPQGGLTALGSSPGGEPLRLFTPVGVVEPLGGRFVARAVAAGRGLLLAVPDDDPAAKPLVLADGLGGELPLARGVLHALGPAAVPAGSAPLTWNAGAPAPEAELDEARLALEAQAAAADDERPTAVVTLARGIDGCLEALEATRAENRRLLAELERGDLSEEARRAARDALRDSARRSLEAERALARRWLRLQLLLVAASDASASAPWTLHVSSGMEQRRERVEALLRGEAPGAGH
ncbi:MAG: FecR domain-containing protein [Deltaproteobacteria bacterium]|nr:FecR domain-containing protein [Deltaproteobacteria bacterium]